MTGRSVAARLDDILGEITFLEGLLATLGRADIAASPVHRRAVERSLEIISEASRHLPDDLKARHPDIPWRRMADLGNWTRHAYQHVDFDVIWNVLDRHILPLAAALEVEAAAHPPPDEAP